MRKDRLREELKKLEQVRSDPLSAKALSQLSAALAHKNNHVVARAAQIVAEASITGLVDELPWRRVEKAAAERTDLDL